MFKIRYNGNVEIGLEWAMLIAYYRKEMESAKGTAIYKQAPAKLMQTVYLMYHAMSPELAIDRLKESHKNT